MSPIIWPMSLYVANTLLYLCPLSIQMLASNNFCLDVTAVPLHENPPHFVWALTDHARPLLMLPSCSDTFPIVWSPIHGLQHILPPLTLPENNYFTWPTNGFQIKLFRKMKGMNFLYILTFELLSLFSLWTWFFNDYYTSIGCLLISHTFCCY